MTEKVITAREPLSFEDALDTLKRAKDGLMSDKLHVPFNVKCSTSLKMSANKQD